MTDESPDEDLQARLWRKEADRLRQEAEYYSGMAGRRFEEANHADDLADYWESFVCLAGAS
jgi:hypothetical protein